MLPRERLTLQKKVQQQIRLRGLSISRDGLEKLLDFIETGHVDAQSAVEQLLSGLDKLSVDAQIISGPIISQVFSRVGRSRLHPSNDAAQALGSESQAQDEASADGGSAPVLRVLDAFEMPRVDFDALKKQYFRAKSQPSIAGSPDAKASLYRSRVQQLLARTRRSPLFAGQGLTTGLLDAARHQDQLQLATVQGLVGLTGQVRWVLGLVSQLEDGRFFLEDLTSSVALDLASVKASLGMFTENCVVLVLGALQPSGTFKAEELLLPPVEQRDESMAFADGFDFLGSCFMDSASYAAAKSREQEGAVAKHMFVFISDIWLDRPLVMEKLKRVLGAYNELPVVPSVFVLIGNFFSRPCGLAASDLQAIKSSFKLLASLIAENEHLRSQTKFVFVPGPGDPGPCPALPRPGLPLSFAEDLVSSLPNCVLASNPCRLMFLSQEIVVFREELSWQMQRASVVPPALAVDQDPFHHMVATLVHQAHLCPLPILRQPVVWEFDHALSLFPLPNLMVLADSVEEKQHAYENVTCAKLGPFSLDGTFLAYRPSTRTIEPCKV